MKKKWPFRLGITIAIFVVVGLVVWAAILRLRIDHLAGLYSPIYSPDGTAIVYIKRETRGLSWGFGYEGFSAPAHAYVLSDRFSLHRFDLESRRDKILKTLPASPLEGEHLRHYRNRLYALPRTRLRWGETGELEYTIAVSRIKIPRSITYGIRQGQDTWTSGHFPTQGYNEDGVRADVELMNPYGPEHFPSAILAYHPKTGTAKVVIETDDHRDFFPDGVPIKWLAENSHHAEIIRIRKIRDDHRRIKRDFLNQGLTEGEAAMRTIKEMQRLGHYPKSDSLTARKLDRPAIKALADGGATIFVIADGEMQSGVFPDIEKALKTPGREVDFSGRYTIHRDYKNSAKLNALLAKRPSKYHIEFQGRIYEMVITRYR